MLRKCQTALLISEVPSFAYSYEELAKSIGVEMVTEGSWNERYRIIQDIVITGSKHLENINRAYYPNTVVILKNGENPAKFIKEGISHFVFDYTNKYELLTALFKAEPVLVRSDSADIKNLIKCTGLDSFVCADYDFRFSQNIYKYRGKMIYLAESQKRYLAEWLLNGRKDNRKRMVLCNLRKKFGSEFLKDIDRHGQIRGIK